MIGIQIIELVDKVVKIVIVTILYIQESRRKIKHVK